MDIHDKCGGDVVPGSDSYRCVQYNKVGYKVERTPQGTLVLYSKEDVVKNWKFNEENLAEHLPKRKVKQIKKAGGK